MEITRLVQLQGSIDWQSKDEFPDSVQPPLREGGCAVCFSAGSFRAAEINRLTRRSISLRIDSSGFMTSTIVSDGRRKITHRG